MTRVSGTLEELALYGVDARFLRSTPAGFPMWLIKSDSFCPSALDGLLSDAERERAARFRIDSLRHRYVVGHGSLRVLLRYCYGIAVEDQLLELNAFGKPRLAQFPNIHYSMSYSGHYVLLGLNEGDEIGVDIEVFRPISDATDLAEMHYTDKERAEIWKDGLSPLDRSRAFLNVWVRKEACVKAFGQGLGISLNEVECGGRDRTTTVCLSHGQYETGLIQFEGDPIMAWARSVQAYTSVGGPVSKPC